MKEANVGGQTVHQISSCRIWFHPLPHLNLNGKSMMHKSSRCMVGVTFFLTLVSNDLNSYANIVLPWMKSFKNNCHVVEGL